MSEGVRYQVTNETRNPIGFAEAGKSGHTIVPNDGVTRNIVLSEAEAASAETIYGKTEGVTLVRLDPRAKPKTKAQALATAADLSEDVTDLQKTIADLKAQLADTSVPEGAQVALPDAVFKIVFDDVTGDATGVTFADGREGHVVYALDAESLTALNGTPSEDGEDESEGV